MSLSIHALCIINFVRSLHYGGLFNMGQVAVFARLSEPAVAFVCRPMFREFEGANSFLLNMLQIWFSYLTLKEKFVTSVNNPAHGIVGLTLRTAAVTKIFGGAKPRFVGNCPPPSQHKTAPDR